MLISAVGSSAYKFVLLLHILAVIVGFGSVVLNGLYASRAKRALGTPAGSALAEANAAVTWKVAEYVIYSVFIFGFILVFLSGKVGGKYFYGFQKPWVGAAMGLYIVGLAIAHAVLRPADKKMRAIASSLSGSGEGGSPADGPALSAQYDTLYTRAAAAGGVLNVIIAVIVYLMVFKPGQ